MDLSDPKFFKPYAYRITKNKEVNWVYIDSVEIIVARTRSILLEIILVAPLIGYLIL
jgi:hypothetical protein